MNILFFISSRYGGISITLGITIFDFIRFCFICLISSGIWRKIDCIIILKGDKSSVFTPLPFAVSTFTLLNTSTNSTLKVFDAFLMDWASRRRSRGSADSDQSVVKKFII